MLSFNSNFSFFFCLDELSIRESGILKSPTITELGLIYILISNSLIFAKLVMAEFGTHMFGIVIFYWLIALLIRVKCHSLSFLINFRLKSMLSDIRIATTFYSLVPFAWNNCFHPSFSSDANP